MKTRDAENGNTAIVSVLIAESDLAVSAALERFLAAHPSVRLAAIARDGESALELAGSLDPDLIFLSSQLPGWNWTDRNLNGNSGDPPDGGPVYIVTGSRTTPANQSVARRLIHLDEPFEESRFIAALEDALCRLDRRHRGSVTAFPAAPPSGRLPIRHGGRTFFVELSAIDYVEAAGNYVSVHAGASEYTFRATLSRLAAELQPHDFVRIHRRIIVNRKNIREMRPWPTGEYVITMNSGKELTLSRGYRSHLELLLRIA